MPEALTELERRVLDYLVQYLRVNTYQPSIRDIGREFAIKSTKTVSELLQSLADKGWIERDPSRSRGVRLLGADLHPDTVTVPVYLDPDGQPAQGVALDRRIALSASSYIVGMPDANMRAAGIEPGDLLLVEPVEEQELQAGDVVYGTYEGAPLVRQLASRGDGRALESVAPLGAAPVPLKAVRVLGRAHGLVRRLRQPAGVETLAAARIPA